MKIDKKQLHDELVEFEEEYDDEAFDRFVDRLDKSNQKYSDHNLLLLYMQHVLYKQRISMVKGIKEWEKLGRKIKKGGNAVYIYAPIKKTEKDDDGNDIEKLKRCYLIPIFDISQTELISG